MVVPTFVIPEKKLWGDVFTANAPDCAVEVLVIPCWYDNYAFVVYDKESKNAAAIDAIVPEEFQKVIKDHGLNLKYILTTHHHMDHSHGNAKMHELFPNVPIVGFDSTTTPCMTQKVNDQQDLDLSDDIKIRIYTTPGHTIHDLTYTFYHSPSSGGDLTKFGQGIKRPAIFTGDFLFNGGCGKFFECKPEIMFESIKQTVQRHAPNTYVFGGHEYGIVNMLFAADFESSNKAIQEDLRKYREDKTPCIPSSFEHELKVNPFIRAVMTKEEINNEIAKSAATGQELLAKIREMKTEFSAVHKLVCVGG